MTLFQPGDPIEYLKPRKERGPDGWYDRIPGTYVCASQWGRSLRYKICIEVNGFAEGRYVSPLSIRQVPTSEKQP